MSRSTGDGGREVGGRDVERDGAELGAVRDVRELDDEATAEPRHVRQRVTLADDDVRSDRHAGVAQQPHRVVETGNVSCRRGDQGRR